MRKGDRIMKEVSDRRRLHLDTVDKLDYRALLAGQLEASADRICEYLDRLHAGTDTLRPIEYDRLLDAYRAEMIRYDRLDQELAVLEMPKKHISKELQRKRNEERRAKIIY